MRKSRLAGVRGGARARAPWGPKGPGPLGAPRASSNSRKSTFSHFPRLLTATERPHSVHRASTPKKSRFFVKIFSFLISSEFFRLSKIDLGRFLQPDPARLDPDCLILGVSADFPYFQRCVHAGPKREPSKHSLWEKVAKV